MYYLIIIIKKNTWKKLFVHEGGVGKQVNPFILIGKKTIGGDQNIYCCCCLKYMKYYVDELTNALLMVIIEINY